MYMCVCVVCVPDKDIYKYQVILYALQNIASYIHS